MILGLAEPTSGTARVFGLEPHDAIRHGLVSAVMQTGGLLKDLTVRETLDYRIALRPPVPVAEILTTAGLTGWHRARSASAAVGQQRLRFGMALVSDPELVISTNRPQAWT